MQLDYVMLADYVRQDQGVVHIMAAGIDTIQTAKVPHVQQIGVALRISFDSTEPAGQEHEIRVTFVGPDQPILMAGAEFRTPEALDGLPVHWRRRLGVALQLPVLLPSYGDYTCEVSIDDGEQVTGSADFRVIQPAPPSVG